MLNSCIRVSLSLAIFQLDSAASLSEPRGWGVWGTSPSPSPRPWFTGSLEPSSSSWSSCWSSWEWLTVIGTVTGINTSCVGTWPSSFNYRPPDTAMAQSIPYIIFIAEEVRHNQHTRSSMPPPNWSDMGPGKINTVTWSRRLSEKVILT